MYGHMKMLIEKGKEANDSNVQLMNEEDETIADEEKVKDIIENFWGDIFCLKGNATYGIKKELVDGGMKKEVWSGRDLHVHNEMVMKEICKGGSKSGLYGHMKMLIEKGKEANDSNVQLMNEEDETIADEEKVKNIMENLWGDLF